jgi:2-keto-3-deoxy-L-fuconate dehydrogenase
VTEFDGAVAIVTGGASGIGAATAALLHARGARVAVLDRDLDGVPAEYFAAACDVTDGAQVDAAAMSPRTTTPSGTACSTSTSSASPA